MKKPHFYRLVILLNSDIKSSFEYVDSYAKLSLILDTELETQAPN